MSFFVLMRTCLTYFSFIFSYKLYQVEFQTDENWYQFNDEWNGQDPLDVWHVYAPDKIMSVFISTKDNEYFLNYWLNKNIEPKVLNDKIGM